jgi:hypothetical protein
MGLDERKIHKIPPALPLPKGGMTNNAKPPSLSREEKDGGGLSKNGNGL